MTLLGFILLSTFLVVSKTHTASTLASVRTQLLMETEYFLHLVFRKNVQRATSVHPESYSNKIALSVVDVNGTPSSLIYRLQSNALQYSTDGGSTWNSPYNRSAYTRYAINNGRFLYCGYQNNCTDFQDTNGNGVYEFGVDNAGTIASGYTGTPLIKPEQAVKIALNNFVFDRQVGNPPISRSIPDLIIHLNRPLVRMASPLVQTFATNTANSSFATVFDVRGVYYDHAGRQLLVVGRRSSGTNVIYRVSIDGVSVNTAINTGISGIQMDAVFMENDNRTIGILDETNSKFYRVNTSSGSIDTTIDTSTFITAPKSIAFDVSTPSNFYIIGMVSGSIKILERNKTTAAAVNTWSVPAGLTSPAGMFIEPLSGDFYVIQNTVGGSGATRAITLYKIARSSSTTADTFTINLADVQSNATSATTNFWGLGYNPFTNHLFLSDTYSDQIYEVMPNRLISARN